MLSVFCPKMCGLEELGAIRNQGRGAPHMPGSRSAYMGTLQCHFPFEGPGIQIHGSLWERGPRSRAPLPGHIISSQSSQVSNTCNRLAPILVACLNPLPEPFQNGVK